jgi:GT2 family glycosyltransferase
MDLAIIIVNWNTGDLLKQCLQSVYGSQTSKQYEVWVVDNGSSDGSPDMITNRYPQTKIISNKDNTGFAHANNQAIIDSTGDYLLLLNPDTVINKDVMEVLSNYLDEHPDVGAVGPRLLNADGTLQESAYPRPTLVREFWRLFHLDRVINYAEYPMEQWSHIDAKEIDVLMGACFMVRRKALDQVGLLDDEFFIYSEEVDLCTRIRNYGWRISWLPTVTVIHLGGESTKQIQQEMFLQLYQGKIQYFRKHHTLLEVWLYKLVLFFATLARLALTPFVFFERTAQKEEHLKLSSNYRRLLWSIPGL